MLLISFKTQGMSLYDINKKVMGDLWIYLFEWEMRKLCYGLLHFVTNLVWPFVQEWLSTI